MQADRHYAKKRREDKMNRRTLSVFIGLAMAALACACNLLPGGEGGGEPAPPSPTPAGILLQDDFSDPSSGWEVGDYDFGSVGYKEGVYFVTATVVETPMWGVANHSFDDLVIEVDATLILAGPENNSVYGVVCREQGDGDGYYLRISGDGYYSIARSEGRGFELLVDGIDSNAIGLGDAVNHIRVTCNGPTLDLHVNGQHLATVEDNTYASGDIALTATSYENEATQVHFDNIVVRKP